MKTYIINIVAGPGVGKSTIAAIIYALLKKEKYHTEIILEKAKQLVWKKNFEKLNNQYYLSQKQKKLLKLYQNKVKFIVTDGSLFHGIIYNKINPDNTSNIKKTEKAILKWWNEFNNIVIYLKRNKNIPYDTKGRIQNLKEAKKIDKLILKKLNKYNIKYKKIKINNKCEKTILKYIKQQTK